MTSASITMTNIAAQMTELGRNARRAAAVLARTPTDVKNRALLAMKDALLRDGALRSGKTKRTSPLRGISASRRR